MKAFLADRAQSAPDTFGASFPKENLNSNRNRGFEIELGHRGQIGKDFSYSVSANFTYARERVCMWNMQNIPVLWIDG